MPGRREGRGAISFIDFGPVDHPPLIEELISVVSERQGGGREDIGREGREGRPRTHKQRKGRGQREGRPRTQQQRPAFPPVNRDHSGLARGEEQHARLVSRSTINWFLSSNKIICEGLTTICADINSLSNIVLLLV